MARTAGTLSVSPADDRTRGASRAQFLKHRVGTSWFETQSISQRGQNTQGSRYNISCSEGIITISSKFPDGDDQSPEHDDSLVGVVQGCLTVFAQTTTGSNTEISLDARNTMRSLKQLQGRYGYHREDVLGEVIRDIKPTDSIA